VGAHIAPPDTPIEEAAQQHLPFAGETFQCTPFWIEGEWWGEVVFSCAFSMEA